MYYEFFTISFIIEMAIFLLSFFINNNKVERILTASISCIISFILAFLCFDIQYILPDSTILSIHSYPLAGIFALIAVIQILRIFAVPYEDLGDKQDYQV